MIRRTTRSKRVHYTTLFRSAETRMGKGKGSPEYWVAVVKPGRVLFEVEGLTEEEAKETFKQCGYKLPIKTKMVSKREVM